MLEVAAHGDDLVVVVVVVIIITTTMKPGRRDAARRDRLPGSNDVAVRPGTMDHSTFVESDARWSGVMARMLFPEDESAVAVVVRNSVVSFGVSSDVSRYGHSHLSIH